MLNVESNFTWLDWGIVAGYLSVTVVIGIYVNRFIGNMADYVVAGRSLGTFIGVATMTGTELGLVTVMYAAQKGFTGGFAAFHIGLAAGVVSLIVGLTGFIVVPLRRMKVMTIPEFYGKRFGNGVRVYGALLLAGAGILNMGMFLKAGAIFVTALTGLNDPFYVQVVMTVLIVLVLVYTILGGMVSVVITDYLQFIVLSFGMLLACFFAVRNLGWDSITKTVSTVHGQAGFSPLDSEGFGPSYIVWMLFVAGLVSCAVWQTAVMRSCAAENEQVVRRLYIWSSIGFLVRFLLPQFLGICALAYFWHTSEGRAVLFTSEGLPIDDAELTMSALPLFLSQVLPAGLIGVIGAGMLAAFMSTHDSYLLCWASVLVEDVAGPLSKGRLSTAARLMLARVFIFLIGLFLLVWSLWYPLGQDLWDYMAVTGAIYFIGATALLVFGIYWKRASRAGAYLALTSGLLAVLGLDPIKNAVGLDRLEKSLGFNLSEAHIGLFATAAAIVLMVVGSLLLPDRCPSDMSKQESTT